LNIIEAINSRKSIRGFKPDPVPKDVLEKVLEVASRAPSSMNTQPWEFSVVAGDALDGIRQANVDKMKAGEAPRMETPRGGYQNQFRERQVALGMALYGLMGIQREDREKRAEWMQRGFRFFDAPAAIIISHGDELGDGAQFDIGTVSQTIALAALEHGLGTCIMGQGIMYPDTVRQFTGIAESSRICIALAIGYPDWDFPANEIVSAREPLEVTTTWHGF
jgi:nitroreductase